jgi:RNA polymerase sigma factor (sigma-70 family)
MMAHLDHRADQPVCLGYEARRRLLTASPSELLAVERQMERTSLLGIHVTVNRKEAGKAESPRQDAPDSDFNDFYQREFARAARFAWLLVRSSAPAEDLAQEAFIALSSRFKEVENPSAFLHRVLINQARTWQRNEHRNKLKLIRAGQDVRPLLAADAQLFDLVGTLSYRQRVVVVARYWLGWSEAEIADALGCRPGTVKSLASRALAQLKREITDDDRA